MKRCISCGAVTPLLNLDRKPLCLECEDVQYENLPVPPVNVDSEQLSVSPAVRKQPDRRAISCPVSSACAAAQCPPVGWNFAFDSIGGYCAGVEIRPGTSETR